MSKSSKVSTKSRKAKSRKAKAKQEEVVEDTAEEPKAKKKKVKAEKHNVLGMRVGTMGPICYEAMAEGLYTKEELVVQVAEHIEKRAMTSRDKPVNAKNGVGFWMLPRQQRDRNFAVRSTEAGIVQAIPFSEWGEREPTDADFEAVFGGTKKKGKKVTSSKSHKKKTKKAA